MDMVKGLPSSNKAWKDKFFFVSGREWEFCSWEEKRHFPISGKWGFPSSSSKYTFYRALLLDCIVFYWDESVHLLTYFLGREKIVASAQRLAAVEAAKKHDIHEFSLLVTPESLADHLLGPEVGRRALAQEKSIQVHLLLIPHWADHFCSE